MPSDVPSWRQFRQAMPVAKKWAYFDHAAVAPLPEAARMAIAAWLDEAADEGDTNWQSWSRQVEATRIAAAKLLGATAAEVALLHSTTEGINLVAEGLDLRSGDNIVTLDNEFPSNAYPWLNQAYRGVETRRVATDDGRVDLDRLAEACDERTRVVSVSWVGYASGYRVDLAAVAEIAHCRGAFLFVDAIQGLGVFPLDVSNTPIDFLAADGHKWLLGPEGAGLFYVRRELLERLRVVGVGWHSVPHASDYSRIELVFKPTAARFEGGTQNMAGFIGLGASLELLNLHGTQAISRQVLAMTDLACEELSELGAIIHSHREGDCRSGIVSFELPGQDPQALRQKCLTRGVALACRNGRLRIAPHGYACEEDVERLVEALGG